MPIILGNGDVLKDLQIGNKNIKEVHIGNKLVYKEIPKRIDIVLNGVLQTGWKIRIRRYGSASLIQNGTFNQIEGYVRADVPGQSISISNDGTFYSALEIYNPEIIIPKSSNYIVYLKGNFDISDNVTRTGSTYYQDRVFMGAFGPLFTSTGARISAGYGLQERTYPYTLNEGSFSLIPILRSRWIAIQSKTPIYSIGSTYYYYFHSNQLIDLYMIRED